MLALTAKKVQAGYQHKITFVKVRAGRQPQSITLERDENLVFQVTEEESKCTPEQVAQIIRDKGGRVNGRKELVAAIREVIECGERTAIKFIATAIRKTDEFRLSSEIVTPINQGRHQTPISWWSMIDMCKPQLKSLHTTGFDALINLLILLKINMCNGEYVQNPKVAHH